MRRAMRTVLCLGLLAAPAGCASWSKNQVVEPSPPLAPTELPKADDLVRYMNREARKLQSIESRDLSIQTRVKGRWVPSLDGWMVVEKPKNFRLTANKFGPQVDLGSNQSEFWYWVKEGPPYLFHCSYAEFEKGVSMPFPFQPEWVLQALGMAEFPADGTYTVEQKGGTIELIEETTDQGQPVRKVTVFNARRVAPPAPQVVSHVIQNARGEVLSKATITKVAVAQVPGTGETVVYPREVSLEWPAEQLTMKLQLDEVMLNESIDQTRAARLFTRPRWDDIPAYDLARRPDATPSSRVRPAGGYTYRGR